MAILDTDQLEVRLAKEIYPALCADSTYQRLSKRAFNAMTRTLITFTPEDKAKFLVILSALGRNSNSDLTEVTNEDLVLYIVKYIAFYLTMDYIAANLKGKVWQIPDKEAELRVSWIAAVDLDTFGIFFNYQDQDDKELGISLTISLAIKIPEIKTLYLDWPFTLLFYDMLDKIGISYSDKTLRNWTTGYIYDMVRTFLIKTVGV